MQEDLPAKLARVEVPGIKVEVNRDDTWQTVGMTVALIVLVYIGIKIVNYVFDKIKNRNSLWK